MKLLRKAITMMVIVLFANLTSLGVLWEKVLGGSEIFILT